MKRALKVEAAAKINIGLEIGEPRADGYHSIAGIFHSVGIADAIVCEVGDGEGIAVEGNFDCAPEATTVWKAARLFLERTGERCRVRLAVQKEIPVMAGRGGGSADAAATIAVLDRLLATGLDYPAMRAIGAKVGADVPFFLPGGAALVSGLGEIIEPIAPRPELGIVLAMPPFGVATKWAYSQLDAFRRANASASPIGAAAREPGQGDSSAGKAALASMFRRPIADWSFANSFEPMLRAKYPVYGELAELLGGEGAQYAAITGSGACMYGVFASFDAARAACERLETSRRSPDGPKTLSGMVLRAVKPLETSIFLR
jgi:4-diphosphocytidyl-2-C-methyl-D-erythritol kinase